MPTQKKHSRPIGYLLAGCLLAPAALAADNPGAHEHGQARLQMALEGNRIDLMLSSPAYNLAGFEHQARTDEQKQQLADIRQWLQTTPLINTEAGNCRVSDATVQLGKETGSHHGHSHHQKHHKDGEHHHKEHHHKKHHHDEGHHAGHHDDKHHSDEASHRDYEVAQQLACDGITNGDGFTSPLPGRFPELQQLAIEWVGPSGQGSTLITGPGQSFTLSQ